MRDALLMSLVALLSSVPSFVLHAGYAHNQMMTCAIVGALLGDLKTGCIIGAEITAIYMGNLGIAGAPPSDSELAGIVATYFCIKSGLDLEAALALSYPVGLLGSQFITMMMGVRIAFVPWLERILTVERNPKKYDFIMILLRLFFSSFTYITVFIAIALGSSFVESVVFPTWLIRGFSATGRALAGLGMAITLNLLWDKDILGFFFIGFILFKALGLSLTQIAVLGTAFALIYLAIDLRYANQKSATVSEEGDDFDL